MTRRSPSRAGEGALHPAHPYAGGFEEIQCVGEIRQGSLSVRTTHTFEAERIRTRWQIERKRGSEHLQATVRFPTWASGATIVAVLKSHRTVVLSAGNRHELALSSVSRFVLRCGSGQSGYSVRLLRASRDARVRVAPGKPQRSNPHPGPQLVLEVAHGDRWRGVEVEAEIVPGATAAR